MDLQKMITVEVLLDDGSVERFLKLHRPEMTLYDLQYAMWVACQVLPSNQKLIFDRDKDGVNTVELSGPTKRLSEFGVMEGSIIHLYEKVMPRGDGGPPIAESTGRHCDLGPGGLDEAGEVPLRPEDYYKLHPIEENVQNAEGVANEQQQAAAEQN